MESFIHIPQNLAETFKTLHSKIHLFVSTLMSSLLYNLKMASLISQIVTAI